MYNAFFGFTQSPFNMSPDPSFLFRSPQHEEALANLIYGVQSRKGFIVLAGEVGTGKTTMLECLREFLNSQQIAFASLFNSRLTVDQFFEMLAYDLDLPCNRLSKSRTAGDLSAEEIAGCFGECEGDLDAMVARLQVSKRALSRRLKELGLVGRAPGA